MLNINGDSKQLHLVVLLEYNTVSIMSVFIMVVLRVSYNSLTSDIFSDNLVISVEM